MPDRHVGVRADVSGPGREDRGVILAAAVNAHAARAGERTERQPALDRAEVPGQVEWAGDGRAPVRALVEAAAPNQGGGDADDERTGTADAGGPRQVAAKDDVGAKGGAGEVARQPARDDRDVLAPARTLARVVVWIELDAVPRRRIHRAHEAVVARPGRNREPARHGRDERRSARIVGVLAEHLDASGHEPRPRGPVARRRVERVAYDAHHRASFGIQRRFQIHVSIPAVGAAGFSPPCLAG
jgi:hypothetical protein